MNKSFLGYDIDVPEDDDFDITDCEDWEEEYENNACRRYSTDSTNNKHTGIHSSNSSFKNEHLKRTIHSK